MNILTGDAMTMRLNLIPPLNSPSFHTTYYGTYYTIMMQIRSFQEPKRILTTVSYYIRISVSWWSSWISPFRNWWGCQRVIFKLLFSVSRVLSWKYRAILEVRKACCRYLYYYVRCDITMYLIYIWCILDMIHIYIYIDRPMCPHSMVVFQYHNIGYMDNILCPLMIYICYLSPCFSS